MMLLLPSAQLSLSVSSIVVIMGKKVSRRWPSFLQLESQPHHHSPSRGPLFWPLCLQERTQRRQEIKSSIYLPRKDRHVCPGVTMLHCETWSCERNTKRRRYQLCQCGTGAVRCNPRDEARPNKREDVEVKH